MSITAMDSTDEEVTFKDHNKTEDSVKMHDVKSDTIRPEDSVSQRGSSTTSASWRIRTKAKRAALVAEVTALKEQQELVLEEIKLKQRKTELLLKIRLKVAEAEEAVYEDTRSKVQSNIKVENVPVRNTTESFLEQKTEPSKYEPSQQGSSTPVRSRMKPASENPTLTSQDDKSTGKMDSDVFHHLQQGQKQHQQLLEAIIISSTDIMSFDGNPLNFFEFIRSFDSVIGNSSLDNNAKLLKLYHLCSGAAKDIIQCCLMMHQDDGYFHARTLLTDRFGSDHKISDAWIKKVTEGPVIQSNPKHLRDFADQLKTCAETLMALGMLHEMSSGSELVKVIERLPFHLRCRWLRYVKTIRDSGRQPNIQDAVEFITNAADELNDPVFGALLMGGPKNSGSARIVTERTMSGRGQTSMFTTSVNSSTKNCIMCQDSHDLFGCQEFKAMEPDERFDFAFKNRLCFSCLLPGHTSSRCILNRTCSVEGCNRRHTKFLHTGRMMRPSSGNPTPWRTKRELNDSSTQTENDEASHASCNATGAGGRGVALPRIPVTVSAAGGGESIETLALLDSGSTNSFCLQELTDVLQIKGKKNVIKISTLESPNRAMECEAVKLKVKGSTADKKIEAEFLTRPSLNISTGHMAREEDISRYQHLCGIDLPVRRENQVTILIGQDVPEALMPLEIKAGKPGEVYAVKTVLGWTLNGPLGNGSSLQSFLGSTVVIPRRGPGYEIINCAHLEFMDHVMFDHMIRKTKIKLNL